MTHEENTAMMWMTKDIRDATTVIARELAALLPYADELPRRTLRWQFEPDADFDDD